MGCTAEARRKRQANKLAILPAFGVGVSRGAAKKTKNLACRHRADWQTLQRPAARTAYSLMRRMLHLAPKYWMRIKKTQVHARQRKVLQAARSVGRAPDLTYQN